jgi:hypothetical protein
MSETARHHRTTRVPAGQAATVHKALMSTFAAKAQELAAAAGAYDGAESLRAILDARRELAHAEDALDVLGWEGRSAVGAVELAGPAGLVREVIYEALLRAAEALAERCREYEAGRADAAGLAAAVNDVAVLHRLFAQIEAAEAL